MILSVELQTRTNLPSVQTVSVAVECRSDNSANSCASSALVLLKSSAFLGGPVANREKNNYET